jgi:hypothetical protein
MMALRTNQKAPSRINPLHLKSTQSPGGGHNVTAWIRRGKPTGYQSVIINLIIIGQTIQPETKNKVAARIRLFAVGRR